MRIPMKAHRAVLSALLAVILLCGCSAGIEKISASDISEMTITNLETGEVESIGKDQFTMLADAYNGSARYRDDVGTTHPLRADIRMDDDTVVVIWGGVGDFLGIEKEGKQYNVKSKKLGSWFDQFK
jgi:hypothetical protein